MKEKDFDDAYKLGAETTIKMFEEWTEGFSQINDISKAASIAIFRKLRGLRTELEEALATYNTGSGNLEVKDGS